MEFVSLERSHERVVNWIHHLGGQSVEVPAVPAIEPFWLDYKKESRDPLSAAGPAAFGLAGAETDDPTAAITAVTTVGYTGFVWSPPLLGWVAQTVSLRAAMGVIVVATLGVIGGGLLAPHGTDD